MDFGLRQAAAGADVASIRLLLAAGANAAGNLAAEVAPLHAEYVTL